MRVSIPAGGILLLEEGEERCDDVCPFVGYRLRCTRTHIAEHEGRICVPIGHLKYN